MVQDEKYMYSISYHISTYLFCLFTSIEIYCDRFLVRLLTLCEYYELSYLIITNCVRLLGKKITFVIAQYHNYEELQNDMSISITR